MKKIASSNAPIQILGASQKENDPQNKEKGKTDHLTESEIIMYDL